MSGVGGGHDFDQAFVKPYQIWPDGIVHDVEASGGTRPPGFGPQALQVRSLRHQVGPRLGAEPCWIVCEARSVYDCSHFSPGAPRESRHWATPPSSSCWRSCFTFRRICNVYLTYVRSNSVIETLSNFKTLNAERSRNFEFWRRTLNGLWTVMQNLWRIPFVKALDEKKIITAGVSMF